MLVGITIIIIDRFVQRNKVVTSEALGPGSVLVSRGRRESCDFSLDLKTATKSQFSVVSSRQLVQSIEKRVYVVVVKG